MYEYYFCCIVTSTRYSRVCSIKKQLLVEDCWCDSYEEARFLAERYAKNKSCCKSDYCYEVTVDKIATSEEEVEDWEYYARKRLEAEGYHRGDARILY